MTTNLAARPQAADLAEPRYYLSNLRSVLSWVLQHHADLLTSSEIERLRAFNRLSLDAQSLLARLIMRVPVHFVVADLHYHELEQSLPELLNELVGEAWVLANPCLSAELVVELLNREQLRRVMALWVEEGEWSPRGRKRDWEQSLVAATGGQVRSWREWWGNDSLDVIAVPAEVTRLWQRVRLMFFGNLRQDWREFVLTELGHQRYEPVPFAPAARAFQRRSEVDAYLQLAAARDQLKAGSHWQEVWLALPQTSQSSWLQRRRARVLEAIGKAAQRAGDARAALAAFDSSGTPTSRVYAWRLREQLYSSARLYGQLQMALGQGALTPLERQACERIAQRLRRRLDGTPIARRRDPWPVEHVTLPGGPGSSVELRLAAALATEGGYCRYVENTLHTGLFALLCWHAVYAPVPGAFFHPFQRGPADLLHDSFGQARVEQLESCLATLRDGTWQEQMRQTWSSRHGVASSLMAWNVWDETLLEGVTSCMSATHVELLLRRLLQDLRAHRSGMPDLFRWWPRTARYEWIEVKGPGDRVQDHQRLWLEFLHRHEMPVRVVHVNWSGA